VVPKVSDRAPRPRPPARAKPGLVVPLAGSCMQVGRPPGGRPPPFCRGWAPNDADVVTPTWQCHWVPSCLSALSFYRHCVQLLPIIGRLNSSQWH
jgi:hypothetical protein